MPVTISIPLRLLSVALSALLATQAGAHSLEEHVHLPAERGRVVHRAVCERAATPDEAICHARVVMDERSRPMTSGAGTIYGYTPANLQAAYNVKTATLPPFVTSTPVIAIIDAYDYPNALSDLNVYRAQFGLPVLPKCKGVTTGPGPCFNKVGSAGTATLPAPDATGWSQEAALDLDMASAMCPQCTIVLVEAGNSNVSSMATAANTAAATLRANVVSNSYGASESGTSSLGSFYQHLGVAMVASAGDTGYGVQFPASYPYVIAVGGTSLAVSTTTRGFTEKVWSDSYGGTGSGCSSVFGQMSWQTAALSKLQRSGCAKRVVADVAAVADPATGVAIYGPTNPNAKGTPVVSGWMVFGGTSASAPIVAAMYALNYGITGVTPTFANPYKYAGNPAYLNDVQAGANGGTKGCGAVSAATYYLCDSVAGFDGPTGLGTPNGYAAF